MIPGPVNTHPPFSVIFTKVIYFLIRIHVERDYKFVSRIGVSKVSADEGMQNVILEEQERMISNHYLRHGIIFSAIYFETDFFKELHGRCYVFNRDVQPV